MLQTGALKSFSFKKKGYVIYKLHTLQRYKKTLPLLCCACVDMHLCMDTIN
jgi:hypothetical protein